MNIAKISTFIYNNELYNNIQASHKCQYESIDNIKVFQEEKFIKLINHSKKNVPYYKERLKNINKIGDIDEIEFLTKNAIRENNIELKAVNISKNNFLEKSTSGSTGESLYFFTDINSFYRKAISIRGDSWAGLRYGDKAIHFWGAERDIEKNKSLFKKIKDSFIIKEKMISTYHMSNSDLERFIDIYNNYCPKVIISYPSPLFHLAQYIELNKIEVMAPKGIITSAETLFPFQRDKIEKVFKSKIFNRYGSREFGHIAAECERHDGLHINSDRFVLEIINLKGIPCEFGELGEIVITDLDNYVFPFIRYKTGDLGILTDRECTCGRNLPLLKKVEGRIFDLIVGVNGNVVAGTFWTLLKHKVRGWKKFQIIQEKKDELNFKVEKNDEIEDNFTEILSQIVKDKLGSKMRIEVEFVDKIPLTNSGKHRWIISKISPYVS